MSDATLQSLLRSLPSVDALLDRPAMKEPLSRYPRELVVRAVRSGVDRARRALREESHDGAPPADVATWTERLSLEELDRLLRPSLVPVLNATGVILHTNLGRAPLGSTVLGRTTAIASGYSNLEYDLAARERGSRHAHVEGLVRSLLGVDAALVVNNCAAAVLLVVSALARGREVIVSRGELIEIGGSFRIPEVMEQSGAVLREVGTTNRTRLADYERALNERTGLLFKAHRSNFAIVGFTEEVDGADLAALGRRAGIPAVEDLGSGLLVDLAPYGIRGAETVQDTLAKGLDLVCFSGDKLLGGPQAGLVVGRADLVARLRSHPLTRALRVDKLVISALETTLLSYLDGSWRARLPALAMLTASADDVRARCERLRDLLLPLEGLGVGLAIVPSTGKVGGGTLPLVDLHGYAVRLRPATQAATAVEEALRLGSPSVVGRLEEDSLLLDLRTVPDEALRSLAEAVATAVSAGQAG